MDAGRARRLSRQIAALGVVDCSALHHQLAPASTSTDSQAIITIAEYDVDWSITKIGAVAIFLVLLSSPPRSSYLSMQNSIPMEDLRGWAGLFVAVSELVFSMIHPQDGMLRVLLVSLDGSSTCSVQPSVLPCRGFRSIVIQLHRMVVVLLPSTSAQLPSSQHEWSHGRLSVAQRLRVYVLHGIHNSSSVQCKHTTAVRGSSS